MMTESTPPRPVTAGRGIRALPPRRPGRKSPHDFILELVDLEPLEPEPATLAAKAVLGRPFHHHPGATVSRAELPDGERIAIYELLPESAEAPWLGEVQAVMHRLCAELPVEGLLVVREVEPGGRRFACEPWSVGTTSDLGALGWDLDRRMRMFRQIAVTIDALHRRSIALGRLWPGAVVLSDSLHPRVDALAAMAPGSDENHAVHRDLAPEIVSGGPASVAADIYGLGRVLRFLATNGGTETQPRAFDPVIARACARAPRDRHASAVELLTELQEALATLPHTHSGRPLTPPRSAGRPRRATPAPAPRRRGSGRAMLIAGLVLVVAAMIVALVAAAQTTAIETTAASGVLLLAVGIWRKRRKPAPVLTPRTIR